MTYDQAKRIVCNPDAHSDEEFATAWPIFLLADRPGEAERQVQPRPSTGKVYRPRDGVAYWWDVSSKSWHLKMEGCELKTFRLMKQAKQAIAERSV